MNRTVFKILTILSGYQQYVRILTVCIFAMLIVLYIYESLHQSINYCIVFSTNNITLWLEDIQYITTLPHTEEVWWFKNTESEVSFVLLGQSELITVSAKQAWPLFHRIPKMIGMRLHCACLSF